MHTILVIPVFIVNIDILHLHTMDACTKVIKQADTWYLKILGETLTKCIHTLWNVYVETHGKQKER